MRRGDDGSDQDSWRGIKNNQDGKSKAVNGRESLCVGEETSETMMVCAGLCFTSR